MGGVNKVIILGNLGKDPEVSYTPSGQPRAVFSLATNESWTDREGKRQERTEWHRVIAWGRLAEICGQYLNKGRQVYIEGRLQTREWNDRDGNKRWTTEVVARDMVLIGGRGEEAAGAPGGSQPLDDASGSEPPIQDDDIPF